MTPSPHFTIRTTPDDPFDDLKDRLGINRTEALRTAARAVLRSPDLVERIRAELEVRAFVDRLVAKYPPRSQLRVSVTRDDIQPRLMWPRNPDGIPVDDDEIDLRVRHEGDETYFDLVDPRTGFGLHNAWWNEKTEDNEVFIPLKAINVPMPLTGPEPVTVTLPDGRTAVMKQERDGSIKRYVLDDDGRASALPIDQRAQRFHQGREAS